MDRIVIDLNADVGEWTGELPDTERSLLGVATTAHVACGAHAGDAGSVERMVALAAGNRVALGAHPSYPDREGFGRRPVALDAEDVATMVVAQVRVLQEPAHAHGVAVRSVKPHGALYHRLSVDAACADAVARALVALDEDLVLVVPSGSATRGIVDAAGIRTVAEGFCDRAYRPDGSLVARADPGALLVDPAAAARQALAIVLEGTAIAIDGSPVRVDCESLCVHGDTPGAGAIAAAVRDELWEHGISLQPISSPAVPARPHRDGGGGPAA